MLDVHPDGEESFEYSTNIESDFQPLRTGMPVRGIYDKEDDVGTPPSNTERVRDTMGASLHLSAGSKRAVAERDAVPLLPRITGDEQCTTNPDTRVTIEQHHLMQNSGR